MNTLRNLTQQYVGAYGQARNANEQRYGDVLRGYNDRIRSSRQMINRYSNQSMRDVRRDYADLGAQTTQSAIDRGLYNTTIQDSLQQGVERERQAQLQRVRDSVNDRRIANYLGTTSDRLGFMERRTDAYPDMGLYSQLAQGAGRAAGYGAGLGGGGGAGGGAAGVGGGQARQGQAQEYTLWYGNTPVRGTVRPGEIITRPGFSWA